jgi:hypothetical protein
MGKRTGKPRGRPAGSKNKTFSADVRKLAAAGGMTPLEYMMAVMRDPNTSDARRDRMARDAAPYMHAKLANIEHAGNGGGPIQFVISKDDENL